MENRNNIHTYERNINNLWKISDKWFRILEFSLIIGTLYYFKEKTGDFIISLIYWASWAIFYMWFMEIGEYISEIFNSKISFLKKRRRFAWVISMFFMMLIYTILINATNSIMSIK